MAKQRKLDDAVGEYVDICRSLYREVAARLGAPPKELVEAWVPGTEADLTHGKPDWTLRRREVEDWSEHSHAMYRAVEEHPRFAPLVERIAELAEIYAGRVKFLLGNMALMTALRAARRNREGIVEDLRAVVTRVVGHDPGPLVVRGHMIGGYVPGRRKLDDRTWIRPPRENDVARPYEKHNPLGMFDRPVPHAILEARYGEGERPEGDEVGRWLTALRLAAGLPLVNPETHNLPWGPTAFGMSSTISTLSPAPRYPPVEIGRRQILRARGVHDLLERSDVPTFIEAAIDRLSRSIEEPSSVPQRLLYAVMGFEALLLHNEPGQTRALATRLAALLGIGPGEGRALHDRARQAYDLRSKYVHGADLKQQDVAKLTELYPAFREDLCQAIVAAAAYARPKKDLVRDLDDTLVDAARRDWFQRRLRERLAEAGLRGMIRG